MGLIEEELTYSVIGAFRAAYNKLGDGFLENVYVGAVEWELEKRGHHVGREVPIAVHYEDRIIGSYRVDLLVDRKLVIEVKTEEGRKGVHERQLLNYLRCSDIELGLLLIFGERPLHKRVVHTRRFKSFKP
jgi:GxxExxY protein